MTKDDIFVFATAHGTLLFFIENRIVHTNFDDFIPNITYDRGVTIQTNERSRGLIIEQIENENKYCIRTEDCYLSAEPNGLTKWVPHIKGWETFTLFPLEEAIAYKKKSIPKFNRNYKITKISRIIHQTSSERDVPTLSREHVDRLRSINTGWEYRYWNEQDIHDFIYREYGYDILSLYLRINQRYGAARADLFRYLCIYCYGGVYIDIKSGPVVSLDSIIKPDDEYLISFWQNRPGEPYEGWGFYPELASLKRGEYQQWHVISIPGHPFLEKVIEKVLGNILMYNEIVHGVGKNAVLKLTGPIAYTLAISSLLDSYPHRFFDSEAEGLKYQLSPNSVRPGRHYSLQSSPIVL